MKLLEFNNKEYGTGYALPFTCVQIVLSVGFVYVIAILMLPANTFTIPDVALPIDYIVIPISFFGFPLVTVIKHGYRKLLRESELTVSKDKLIYRRMVDKFWTILGHVQEFHVYESFDIERVSVSKRYYTCYGSFSKKVVNNGRELNSEDVTELKIPRAYSSMERLLDCGKH